MSEQEKEIRLRKAAIYTNAAYLLADVCHSFALNTEELLKPVGKQLRYGELKEFKKLLGESKQVRERAQKIATPIYGLTGVEMALDDADWFENIIKLLIDRTGDKQEKMNRVETFLQSMDSEFEFDI